MPRQNARAHEGPAVEANSVESYRRASERARERAQQRPSAHAHHPMPAGKQGQAPTSNNTCHDPK